MMIYNQADVVVKRETINSIRCDICKKVQKVNDENPLRSVCGRRAPQGWHPFTTGHEGWGNDSEESVREWEVCSPACYMELIDMFVNKHSRNQKTGYVGGMSYDFAQSLLEYVEKAE